MERTKSKQRLLVNSGLGIVDKLLVCVLGIVLRRVFVHYLGNEISGLSGLFGNIIDFLNLAIAGFVIVVYPKMYQYNATEDYDNIRCLMHIIKKFYAIISMVIIVVGVVCSFFLDRMIFNNQYSVTYLQVVFLLQVFTQCVRVRANPNQTLLATRECGYIYIAIDIVMNIVMYGSQIYAIIYTREYVVYLLIALVCYFMMNVALEIAVKKTFPWMKGKVTKSNVTFGALAKDMKYSIVMKIADFIFGSTDSVVISKFLGLVFVNAYANYMTIATAVIAMYSAVEGAIKVYFGNKLAVNSTKEEKISFIQNMTFVFYIMGTICGVIYSCLIGDFIHLWLGDTYVQKKQIDILFGMYLFVSMLVCAPMQYLQNFGIFKKEMQANISSAIVNLCVSVLLVRQIGIAGVLIGTLIGFGLRFIQRSNACFSDIGVSGMSYYSQLIAYVVTFIVTMSVTLYFCEMISISSLILQILLKGILSLTISCCITIVFYIKTERGKWIISNLLRRKVASV